jgi:hypothetical protein
MFANGRFRTIDLADSVAQIVKHDPLLPSQDRLLRSETWVEAAHRQPMMSDRRSSTPSCHSWKSPLISVW